MGNLCKTVAVRLKYFDATNSGDDPPKGYTRLNLSDTTNIMIDVPSDVVTQFKEIATPADQRKYLFKLSQDLGDNADLLIRAFLLCFITGPSGPDHFITPSTRESSWAQQQQSFVDELEKFCAGEYGKKLDELSPRALEIVNRVTKAVYELVSVRLLPPSSTSIQSQIASFNGGKLFGTYPLVNCPVHGLGSHDGVLLDPRPFRDAKNRDLSIITVLRAQEKNGMTHLRCKGGRMIQIETIDLPKAGGRDKKGKDAKALEFYRAALDALKTSG